MGMLRSAFGPSKNEIWSQIADEIGGELILDRFWKSGGLRFQHGEWEILLDTFTVQHDKSSSTYTRLRAPFVNKDGLQLKLAREGFFSKIGKLFGSQDIQIGDPYFDEKFVIKGNDEDKIRQLLASDKLKQLIDLQPRIWLSIKDNEGWFGKSYPDDVDLIEFQCGGVVKDKERLHSLFFLFATLLERLVEIDSAYAHDPGVRLIKQETDD